MNLFGRMVLVVLLAGAGFPAVGGAQVVMNAAALLQLAGRPVAAPAAVRPVTVRRVRRVVVRRVGGVVLASRSVVARPVVVVPAVVAPAVLVPGRPAVAVPVVVRPVVAAPKASVAPVAPPKLVSLSVAVRFADGDDALPVGAAALLAPVCRQVGPGGVVVIDAFAPGSGGDPSVAMRDSLSRAFAVRDLLTGCGIPAARIIPRADGAGVDTGVARVTLSGGIVAPVAVGAPGN